MIGTCNAKLAHRLSLPVLGGACDIICWQNQILAALEISWLPWYAN